MKTVDEGTPPAPAQGADADADADAELAERDMRHILESGAALLWVGAPDGARRWVGHALAKVTGLSAQQLTGALWTNAVHPEDAERCVAIDRLCLADERSFTLDYRLRRHDGRYVWVMDIATPCHDAAGRFKGHVGVCVEIDERRLVEDQLAERARLTRIEKQR